MDKIKKIFICPPQGKLDFVLTFVVLIFATGAFIYTMFEENMYPGSYIFSLYVLVVFCYIMGFLVQTVRLPKLLGMLVAGIILRNYESIGMSCLNIEFSSKLRSLALIIILTRAGIGLDADALKKLSFVIFRLAFLPCILEACTVGVVGHFFLGLPWAWSFLLGFILGAVSPAVVVPCMLSLQESGYGVQKGIPTLIIAAASLDDILAISVFGVLLGIVLSTGDNISLKLLKGPLEILAGLAVGVLLGLVIWFFPNRHNKNASILKFFLLLTFNVTIFFGSILLDLSGAGALGCLTLAFTVAYRLRHQGSLLDDISKGFQYLWYLMEALLFGLIGTEVDLKVIDTSIISWGILTIFFGLIIRILISFMVVLGGHFSMREKLFIAISWMPKATVQAAIGSVALDVARNKNLSKEYISYGLTVLTVSVLVILITAPIGCCLIILLGPKLLHKETTDVVNPEIMPMSTIESDQIDHPNENMADSKS